MIQHARTPLFSRGCALSLVGLLALLPALGGCVAEPQAQRTKGRSLPNVILVMADDQGYGDGGFCRHPHLRTPTLDELARDAIRFERFYAAAPVCSPTRGSCMTGRHPYRYGIPGANRGHMLPQEVTLAEILRQQGYRTGHFGKWHLGTLTKTVRDGNRGGHKKGRGHYSPPWDNGFDVCFSTEAKVPTYDPMKTPPRWAGGVGKKKPGMPYGTAYWNESGARVTDDLLGDDSRIIMDRALPFITDSARRRTPFFATIWFHAPHLPVVAGEKHLAPYADIESDYHRHYFGCITALDEQLGRLRTVLRELGVAEDTMLFYCSDNGPEGRTGKDPGTTAGLRGRKRSLFEGGVRVPAFLEWPGRFNAPKTITAPCCTSDYLPTVLDVLGLSSDGRPIDGISLMPLLEGETQARGKPIGFQSGKQATWVEDRFKLVRQRGRTLLFDIPKDPGETNDLAGEQPQRVKRMLAALAAWQASCRRSARGDDYQDR